MGVDMAWYGFLVWVWAYDAITAMVKCFLQVDSRLQKVTRIAPEFGGLVSGVPWWLVKYGKKSTQVEVVDFFLDPSCSAATEAWGDIFQQRIHAEQAAFGGSCFLMEVGA